MPRIYTHRDLTGQRFGRWSVLQEAPRIIRSNGKSLIGWYCRCDCGIERIVYGDILSSGRSRSCGCLREELRLKSLVKPKDQVAATLQFLEYRRNAKERGHVWSLSKEEVARLVCQPCAYCGSPPSAKKLNSQKTFVALVSGIDRIDSKRGYESGNVVPCCWPCNKSKGTMSHEEFMEWISRLVAFRSKLQKETK